MKRLPNSRNADIVVNELDKEILIYDINTHKAISLNETSSIIFKACNGQTSFDELKKKHQFTDDLIYLALDALKENDLLENYQSSHFTGLSRREAIRRVGLATMVALPVITGLIAPLAAHALSNTCASKGCVNGNVSCNPGGGCGALGAGFVCCFAFNSCSCAPSAVCTGNGGQICP